MNLSNTDLEKLLKSLRKETIKQEKAWFDDVGRVEELEDGVKAYFNKKDNFMGMSKEKKDK